MARNKYGRITSELREFPSEEPYFLIRGKDVLAPAAVESYANLLRAAAAGAVEAPSGHQDELISMAQDVSNLAAEIIAWQAANPDRVQLPD